MEPFSYGGRSNKSNPKNKDLNQLFIQWSTNSNASKFFMKQIRLLPSTIPASSNKASVTGKYIACWTGFSYLHENPSPNRIRFHSRRVQSQKLGSDFYFFSSQTTPSPKENIILRLQNTALLPTQTVTKQS